MNAVDKEILKIAKDAASANQGIEDIKGNISRFVEAFEKHTESDENHQKDVMRKIHDLEIRLITGFAIIALAAKFSPDIAAKILAMAS